MATPRQVTDGIDRMFLLGTLIGLVVASLVSGTIAGTLAVALIASN